MRQEHVILRSTRVRSGTRDVFLGPSAAPTGLESAPAAVRLQVDVQEIDRREIPEMTQDRDVVAVAPSVPMRLIRPTAAAAVPAGASASWGIGAVGADTSLFTGAGIVVAVLDTGIDEAHPAFGDVDLVQEDFTGEGNGDRDGHGTHCAGTIFGRTTGGTRIGVAPGVPRAVIGKVFGQNAGGASTDIVRAIQWAADAGAHVISMSLGIDFPGYVARLQHAGFPPELATSLGLEGYRANVQLFERLAGLIRIRGTFAQPTLLVAAAGNASRKDVDPDFEIGVEPPAVSEGYVSVAALGRAAGGLRVADFSNTGANVAAPGVDVVSASPGGGFASMSGTSMATPHVAGVAALWAEKMKRAGPLTLFELSGRLIGSCTTDGLDPGVDRSDVGAGLVRAPQA